jgi:hypothetical protein
MTKYIVFLMLTPSALKTAIVISMMDEGGACIYDSEFGNTEVK